MFEAIKEDKSDLTLDSGVNLTRAKFDGVRPMVIPLSTSNQEGATLSKIVQGWDFSYLLTRRLILDFNFWYA